METGALKSLAITAHDLVSRFHSSLCQYRSSLFAHHSHPASQHPHSSPLRKGETFSDFSTAETCCEGVARFPRLRTCVVLERGAETKQFVVVLFY